MVIPTKPSSCCFLRFSKYAIADCKSVTSISRIADVFFFNSEVFVIRLFNASAPLLSETSEAADLNISLRLSFKYSICNSYK